MSTTDSFYSQKENYDDFQGCVRKYGHKPPFNFPSNKNPSTLLKNFKIYVTVSAAHLYDAVMLYANALHKHIQEAKRTKTVDSKVIGTLARQGKEITDTIIQFKRYRSISGSDIQVWSLTQFCICFLSTSYK